MKTTTGRDWLVSPKGEYVQWGGVGLVLSLAQDDKAWNITASVITFLRAFLSLIIFTGRKSSWTNILTLKRTFVVVIISSSSI